MPRHPAKLEAIARDPDWEPYAAPLLTLRDLVVFPDIVTPLFVGRPRSLAAVRAAEAAGLPLVVVAQRDAAVTEPSADDLFTIGTEVDIGRLANMPDGSVSVLGHGRRRVEIVAVEQWHPYAVARVRPLAPPDPSAAPDDVAALMRATAHTFEQIAEQEPRLPEDAIDFARSAGEPGWLADFIASALELPLPRKQALLEQLDPFTRLEHVNQLLAQELELLEAESRITARMQTEFDESRREAYLRQRLRAIRGELNEKDVRAQELADLRAQIAAIGLPAAVHQRAEREVGRLASLPQLSPEGGVIRTYLDWLMTVPWAKRSDVTLDVRRAADALEADHYGLDHVKERVLEQIAVQQLAPNDAQAPILCFVGPPGTGKTSIGRSIARALGREFVRISLGGVRDEAEIRGHRRTYVGALPGRIVQAMCRASTTNPLFMLDEIDKVGQDFRGDPAAALLELLDPEQNSGFRDHYLELPLDLSDVLFITTANMLEPIPTALLDRLEVIPFTGYLEEEKVEIARRFIVPRQLARHGLTDAGLQFEGPAIETIIRNYTYEAGVRELERQIAAVCRKIARRVAAEKRYPRRLNVKQIEKLLGPARFQAERMAEEDEVGVAMGLAWTASGGDVLPVEVVLMPGRGSLALTGQLGEIMRESAKAAVSFTRSLLPEWGLPPSAFDRSDIHIHLAHGAVPKDGPSAGVALATALISAFLDRPIRRDVGFTGEITLRGRILPVGGIREKCLAARRAGLRDVIIPARNAGDLESIPERLRHGLNIIPVSHMADVLDVALVVDDDEELAF